MPPSPQTMIICQECRVNFSKISNLRAHVKRKHPDKLNDLCPKKLYKTVESCTECNKTFVNKCNLNSHMKHFHPGHYNMMNRSKTINPLDCMLCEYKHHSKTNLIAHFEQSHSLKICIQKYEFSGFDKFESWKYQIEQETKSRFVKMHGSYKTNIYTRVKYSCHRSGQIRQRGTGQRHLKVQGSNKINGFCPASINVDIYEDKRCKCTFVSTHIGHKQDLGHLFLTSKERRNKIPFQNILDSIRDSVSNCQLERLHLLKKKDLRIRHKTSDSMKLDLVVETEEGWEVGSSSTGEIYVVQEVKSSCQCKLVCTQCNVCLHQYSCSCIDSCIKRNMCKHIHLVCKYKKHHQPAKIPEMQLQDNNTLNTDVDMKNLEALRIVESLSQVKETRDSATLPLDKEKVLVEFSEKLKRVESFEELDVIKKCIASIDPILDAVKNQKKSQTTIIKEPAKTPHNKNILQQRRLYRTKKTYKNTKKTFLEPGCSNSTAVALMNPTGEKSTNELNM